MQDRFIVNVSIVIRLADTFLMIKRAKTEEVYPEYWGMPGGKVELLDESLEQAALRECEEEIGIEIKTPLKVVTNNIVQKDDMAVLYVVMMVEIATKIECIPGVEVEKVEWMTKSEIRELEKITSKTVQIIMKYC